MKAFITGIGMILLGFILTSTQRIIVAVYISGNMRVSGNDPVTYLGMALIIIGFILCAVSAKKK